LPGTPDVILKEEIILMSVGFFIVNTTKKEVINFAHLPASTQRELAGCIASAAVTTWYFIKNRGDNISFVSDTYNDWPFSGIKNSEVINYRDVTEAILEELIQEKILKENGFLYQDVDEPNIFIKDYINIWNKDY
jgi:hypothetical protein